MTTKILYAGLNSDDWTNEPLKVIDQILQNFFTSLASQSNMFYKQVESFAFYMQKNQNNPQGLSSDIQQALVNLFTPYFDNITINVVVTDTDSSKKEIRITGSMDDTASETFDLGRAFITENLNILQILKIHNTGN